MKYLTVKLRRDLLRMFPQFFAVLLMAMLSVTIFSGMEGVWNGMSQVSEQYYSDTNLSEAWVYANGISDKQLNEIQTILSVNNAEYSMSMTVDVKDTNNTDLYLITVPDDSKIKLLHRNGTKYHADMEGIWLDENYAAAHNIHAGDSVTISLIEQEYEVKVIGLILHSEFIYFTGSSTATMPDSASHGYAFIPEQYAEKIFGSLHYNEIRLWVKNNSDYSELKNQIKDILGDRYITFQGRDDFTSSVQTNDEIEQTKKMATMFSFVFILLALLTMYTTMSRLVRSQRIQIGTMKALGYKNRTIRLHYALYGLVIPLLGGLLGIITGRLLVSNALIEVKKTTLTLPEWIISVSWVSFAVIALIIIICILSTLLAVNHSLKGLPAETMREEDSYTNKNSNLGRTKSRLSYEWRWVFWDISRNKTRYLIAVIGVAGSMMLMIAGFGLKDSLNYSNDYVFNTQYQYDYKAVLKNYTNDISAELNDLSDTLQWVQETSVDLSADNHSLSGVLTVMDDGDYICLEAKDGETLDLPDSGVVITNKYAELLGVNVGDTIHMEVTGISGSITVKVAEITAALTPQGVYLSRQAWESCDESFIPTSVLLDADDFNALDDTDYFKEITPIGKLKTNMDDLTESVNTVVALLIAASILLSVVILYNLGMLTFVERSREYATMKVMGYRKKELRNLILRDWFATTFPGYLLGVPIGFVFLKVYLKVVSFDSYEWLTNLTPQNFLLISIIVVSCTLCVNLYISHKVQKIVMTGALKSVE
ncbi:MAG: ABC transporter permease [Lachnospiraceae bacterium]